MKKSLNTFVLAILAGFCIGLGGNVFLALMSTNKLLGAVLFTVGLFTICTNGFNLFTGKACYIFDNPPSYLITLIIIWLGNLVGTGAMALIVRGTRLSDTYIEAAKNLVATKNADSLFSLFLLAIVCNTLIYIAVDGYKNNPHEVGKYLALVFGVVVFILAGTEHSIADMYYYAVAGDLLNTATLGNALLRILVISLGNIVGGLILPLGKKLSVKLQA